MSTPRPSLAALERSAASGDAAAALEESLRILRALDEGMGALGGIEIETADFADAGEADRVVRFATRFCAAFGEVLISPRLEAPPAAVEQLFIHHRWIDQLFRVSGFRSAAHLIDRIGAGADGRRTFTGAALIQFLILFSPSSGLSIDLEECLRANPGAAVLAMLGYLSARVCVTARACAMRERLLTFLPGRFDDVTLGRIRLNYTAEVYMHCSYAAGADKHRIKADLVRQMRRACLQAGAVERREPPPPRTRPRILVVTEHFRAGHSVFRTHSRAVQALRTRFEVIGMGYEGRMGPEALACFDAFIPFPAQEVVEATRAMSAQIRDLAPDIILHLGVGMSNHVIALASLRLAPVQCASYGHTATTMSPEIDLMVLPEDFVGSEACFAERVLKLPASALPYAPPAASEPPPPPRAPYADLGGPITVAVPASIMKINADLLRTLAQIRDRASRPVVFEFFPLAAVGLSHRYLAEIVRETLPDAVVHPEMPRPAYLARLGACAFYLSPFPYGNMNSLIDAAVMGVPGVCLDGPEAHAHADAAIFRRLGLPEALIAADPAAYVEAALRLIDEPDWRAACADAAGRADLEASIYAGDASAFADALAALVTGG